MSTHRVPAVTCKLGTVLDLTVAHGIHRVFVDDWRGYQLLTDADAMDRAPGRARLYLVRGALRPLRTAPRVAEMAAETYQEWHARDAAKLGELTCADEITYRQGRVLRIGYRSDKWGRRGATHDYDHDFTERGAAPLLYTDTATIGAAKTIVIVGGDMRITSGGID